MKNILITALFTLFCLSGTSQQISLVKKLDNKKTRTLRVDKTLTIKTFDGEKFKGEWEVLDDETILVQHEEIMKENIMMISGHVLRESKDKALGIGLTVGAGIVFPVAVYYFLGGIAWGFSNGIFVGATLLVLDFILAYAGMNMMGVIPRQFSTLNWEIDFSTHPVEVPIQLPMPVD